MRRPRSNTYPGHSVGSAAVWLVILAIATGAADESNRHTIRVTCAGWWSGWLSATMARWVYPPPADGGHPPELTLPLDRGDPGCVTEHGWSSRAPCGQYQVDDSSARRA